MAKGVSVPVGADTRDFSASVKSGVIQPLADVLTALDGVTSGGDATSEKLVAQLTKEQAATAGTQHAYQDLADTVHSTMISATRSVQQESQKQTDGLELTTREQTRIVREGVTTAGESAKQAALQGLQSIDGTVQGALSAVQNTVSGIFGTMGGEGLAIGAAISTVVGLIAGAFAQAAQSEQDFEADVSSLTAALEKAGDGRLSIDDITQSLQELSQQTDPTKVSLKGIFQVAKDSKSDAVALADAYAGQTGKLKELDTAAQKRLTSLRQLQQEEEYNTVKSTDGGHAVGLQVQAQTKYVGLLDDTVKKNKAAADSTDQYNKALAGLGFTSQEALDAQNEYSTATLSTFDDIGDQLVAKQQELNAAAEAASEKTKKTVTANNVETAQSFLDAQNQELADLQNAGAAKIEIYEKFGSDASKVIAAAGSNTSLLQSLAGATPAQVQAIIDNYGSLGSLAGANLQKDAQHILDMNPLIPTGVKIPVTVDTTDANQKLRTLGNGLIITVGGIQTRNGTRVL